jgi:hypothetical protein
MTYQSHHCSTTLPCSVFLTIFLHTCLALSVLLPFILCAACPFNAPFLFCLFQLLHTASFYTPESLSTTSTLSSLFYILILTMHLLYPLFTMLLHALPMSSALLDHYCNSSASLVVKPMRPSSLGVMPRFLSVSSSRDSLSSLSHLSSFPLL